MSLRCANRVVLGFIVLLFYPLLLSGPFGSRNSCRKCISGEKVTSDVSFLLLCYVQCHLFPTTLFALFFLLLVPSVRHTPAQAVRMACYEDGSLFHLRCLLYIVSKHLTTFGIQIHSVIMLRQECIQSRSDDVLFIDTL